MGVLIEYPPAEFVRRGPWESWPARFRAYLETRGVTPEQAARWNLGWIEEGPLAERVFFPIENRSGEELLFAARAIEEGVPRWSYSIVPFHLRPPVWFGEKFWDKARVPRAVVVEGVFDALAIERAFPNLSLAAFHLLSMPMAGYDLLAYAFDEIAIVTDADPPGDFHAERTARSLSVSRPGIRTRRIRLDSKDPAAASTPELFEALCEFAGL